MTQPSEPKIIKLAIDRIDASNRMRPVSETGVAALLASIEELGVIKDPIHVRKKRRQGVETLVLMAGGHRLAAAQRLGWDSIPARVWVDVTDDWAQLMEIDDNLAGADLSPLELAVFMARRKQVYERLHPEAKAGAAGAAARWDAVDIVSFASSVAEKRDMSERNIRRLVKAGSRLDAPEIKVLSSLRKPVTLKELLELDKVSDRDTRRTLMQAINSRRVASVKDALQDLAARAHPIPVDPVDKAFQKLLETWSRTAKAAKRQFVEEKAKELRALLDEHQQMEQDVKDMLEDHLS